MTDLALSAVLWDMDGTLIDSEPLWLAAEHAMLERYGIAMTRETHLRLIGSGLTAAAEHFQELGVPLSVADIVTEWALHVEAGMARGEIAWRPGARELLASLREAGIPSAIVTMSLRPLAELVAGQLPDGTFDAIVPGDEVAHEKPHPDPYLRGAAALGVPIERCLALEDSPTGLRSAWDAGAVAVGVPNLLALDEAPAHALWPTLAELDAAAVAERFARLRSVGLPA